MNPVFISIMTPQTEVNRAQNLDVLLAASNIDSRTLLQSLRLANGKPWLEFKPPLVIGYSVSHTRAKEIELEAIAILNEARDVGLDLEVWPRQESDNAFLDFVATAQDEKFLKLFSKKENDASVALWVVKEAALKCTGEVMINPRDLHVTHLQENIFGVASSAQATSPHPEIEVALYVLDHKIHSQVELLLGVAMAKGALIERHQKREIRLLSNDWNMAEFRR
jgi:phosphopantetheinyl transferase